MGLLSGLLKKFRPLQVDDSFFGRITYMKVHTANASYWEAKRSFAPTGREIELFIDAPAPEQPPNTLQRQFFENVESRFIEIAAAAEYVLRPLFEKWTHQPLSNPFDVEFTLTSFSIPCVAFDNADWEMSFESKTDENHLFSVAFSGMNATKVSVDG
ncbi:hypothetical protein [Geothrix edaphica]|uniref:hypothetical protein n=1 Tax=Geothrix edaphica TaxID=2927976 RepID=UPI0025542884|nr:hypothetical protein [Geothrix edaphica]